MGLILAFSIPLLLGNVFQQLYSMVDTLIVGRFVGMHALAAVGSTGAISFLVLGFVMGLTGGFSVVIAQRFGAGDEAGVRRAVSMAAGLSLLMTMVLTVVSVLGAAPLLRLMHTPDDIFTDALAYIVIIFAGTGASVFYNLLSGILRALGDSRTPLYFLIVSSVLNVVLDLVLILVFSLGVAGAAYATVISQVVSGVLCLLYMAWKFPILRLRREDWRPDGGLCLLHLRLGLPMAFQFSITAIGIIVLQRAVNGFGSVVVAGFTAASKVEQLTTQPLNTLGITMATYAGQNLGAGEIGRIRTGVRISVLLTLGYSALCCVLVFLWGGQLAGLFLDSGEQQAIDAARQYLNTVSVFFAVLGLLFVFRNTLQGMGSTLVPLLGGVCELVMRTVISLTLPGVIGYTGACLASPMAWIGAVIPLVVTYILLVRRLQGRWKRE